jgi:FixJ family two-component response regulator
MSRRCVYVIDDDSAVRRGVERLLRAYGYSCRAFDSAKDFLTSVLNPCDVACLVLDIRMPEMSGTELQALLRGTEHEVPIVFVTGHGDIPTCVKALKAGAVSFLTKPFDEAALLSAVHEALQQASDRAARRSIKQNVKQHFLLMSPREREVFHCVVRGLLNKQIAAELGIAEKTVKVHRARVMSKMGAESVAELVRLSALLEAEEGPWEKHDA